MDEREKDILRAALIYLQSNLDDALEAFGGFSDETADSDLMSVNGELIPQIKEDEIDQLLTSLQ
jgi:hypothetical protein